MGYYVRIEAADFVIPADKIAEADKAVRRLNKTAHDRKTGGSWWRDEEGAEHERRFFAWMPEDYHLKRVCPTLASILQELGFETDVDDDGNLHVNYYDSKTGNEEVFIEALAPFVKEGSYIEWCGEDSERWRQIVRDGQVVAEAGYVVYGEQGRELASS
jgi:hypothetical protein